MQIPPANFTSVASSTVGATANAQKLQASSAVSETVAATTRDVAELSHGDADRDAQGQGDGLPGQRGNQKKEPDAENLTNASPEADGLLPTLPQEEGGLDLWG